VALVSKTSTRGSKISSYKNRSHNRHVSWTAHMYALWCCLDSMSTYLVGPDACRWLEVLAFANHHRLPTCTDTHRGDPRNVRRCIYITYLRLKQWLST
jgi:hypothetical protein